jgi:hypothetical protein
MDILSRNDLEALATERDGCHISIFMPTHRAGAEIQKDPIRLKNLLREARDHVIESGLRAPQAQALLSPARSLLEDRPFWQHQSDGLAIFVSSNEFHPYRLPFNFKELVVAADHFHIKPLLPLLSGDGRFYVLAISQKELRLLQGTQFSVGEVDLEGVPTSLAEALSFDDPERRLQFHTATGSTVAEGSRPAAFHGHGALTRDGKVDILRYFHQVDKGMQELLSGEQVPLVLAGVDYLLPLYKEANSYRHLVDEGTEGNPQELSNKELHRRAWAIVHPQFQRAQEEAAAQYRRWADTERASNLLEEVVPVAYYGRIDSLFVALGLQCWGQVDPKTRQIRIHKEAKAGDEDLLDTAAVQTLLKSGTVYAVEPEEVPGGAPLAAVFRY